jgi:indoleamine 2,3-dioxygenase
MHNRNDTFPFPRGFLPDPDPLLHLPAGCEAWDALGAELHKLVVSDHLRDRVQALPAFPLDVLQTEAALWRAASLLAYISSLYVLGSRGQLLPRIPAVVAVPFHAVATRLGIPPILSYALQAMVNWRRIDPAGPIAAGNLTLLHNFLGGMDEEWFVTLHIEIEAKAGAALRVLAPAQAATLTADSATISAHLQTIGDTLQTMHDILGRMTEHCDPYIYYHRVRPFMFGWKDNAALPEGVLYEGVPAYDGKPVQLRGETGAQSGIIPAIDAALGIHHERDEMRVYLMEMREYMPPRDRAFVEALEQGPSIRQYVAARATAQPVLRAAYNYAVEKLTEFRTRHIEFAALYILKPAQTTDAVGTGGTPFTYYLKKHKTETAAHLL